MLTYNFNRLFKARGITDKAGFLRQHGLSYNISNRIVSGNFDKISTDIMEVLCHSFNCTPNDIYQYAADKEQDKNESNALMKLVKDDNNTGNVGDILNAMPLEKLKEFEQALRKKS